MTAFMIRCRERGGGEREEGMKVRRRKNKRKSGRERKKQVCV
jgi:hypothetical protein